MENFQVGKLAQYRLGYADLREIRPEIVYASITGYGQTVRAARRPPPPRPARCSTMSSMPWA